MGKPMPDWMERTLAAGPAYLSKDDHPALANSLERELVKEREDQIQAFMSSKDWPDFERRRGIVNGLNAAINICREIQKKLEA